MSSYLNIYVRDKETKQPKRLVSYSSSNPIYDALNENVTYICEMGSEETKYTELTQDILDHAISEEEEEKTRMKRILEEMERHANGNMEIIQDILDIKEFLREKEHIIEQLQFLNDIADDCKCGVNSFECLLANID